MGSVMPDDAAFGCGVGDLPDLSVEGGKPMPSSRWTPRFALCVGRISLHGDGLNALATKHRAEQIDFDHPAKGNFQPMGPFSARPGSRVWQCLRN